jgi:predicted permease
MPSWLRELALRLKGSFHQSGAESGLNDELQAHLEMLAQENMRQGMDPNEARRQARLKLGNHLQIHEDYRRQTGLPFIEVLWQDLRYGLRMLRKSPAFTVIAIATLALGIGANSAIFSVVNGVLLRPLPYEKPDQLAHVFCSAPSKGLENYGASPPDFRTLRERNQTFASLSGFYARDFNLTGTDNPERLLGQVVSPEFFRTLGVKPMLGRDFLPSEEKWGQHHVTVVSYEFWRSHLNSDLQIQGKVLHLDGEPYSVIGVLPASFSWRTPRTIWVPMAWKPKDNLDSHNNYFLNMVGRIKPGTTRERARADLNAIMQSIVEQFPEDKGVGANLKPLHEDWVGDVRPALLILLGAVGFVLLIACVNLANLMLARSAGRQKEIAIRAALGASRHRLLRQFVTESILIAFIGGTVGLGLAYLCLGLLPLAEGLLPQMEYIHLDAWVLLFTLGISLLTGMLFGLLPAFQNARAGKLNKTLKEGGRTSEVSGNHAVRKGLVISEVALALVLLIGSGLALKSFARLLHVDPGFDPEHALSFTVSLPQAYDAQPDPLRVGAPPQMVTFCQETLSRIERLPGVKSAGMISGLPLQGENWGQYFVPLDRPLPVSIENVALVQFRSIAGHSFSSLGIHAVKGRVLDERDQSTTPLSVVVNETLARRFWPAQDPIGKLVLLTLPENLIPRDQIPADRHPPKFTVVGIVPDVRYGGLDQASDPAVYASITQGDFSMHPSFVIRTAGEPTGLIHAIRSELEQVDKNLPMADIHSMNEIVAQSVAQPRLEAILLGVFGGLAMLLAAVGIYGVMSYTVTQRTNEIGIRMALGASRAAVLQMIISQGVRLAAIGLAIGIVLAFGVTRVMTKVLFGVSPTDPAVFAGILVLLGLVALLACYIPARRATKVDPMIALRYE